MNKRTCVLLSLCLAAAPAHALDWDFDGIHVDLKNRFSAGVALRMQDRNPALLGKTNVEGQQYLCQDPDGTGDDCLSLQGDPAPARRLVAAQGGFNAINHDDGNLNYDKYDIVNAIARLNTDLKVSWGELLVRVRGIGYFDPINTNFEETHTNTLYQPAHTERSSGVEKLYAKGYELMDAYAQYSFTLGERTGAISVGQQSVRWGESGLFALNSISEINPPSSIKYHTPGVEIGELFLPVPLVSLSLDLFDGAGIEGIYQFGWRPVQPDAHGAFQSDIDAFGNDHGEPIYINLGQFAEDPDCRKPINNAILGLISSSCQTARLLPLKDGYPRNGGQYGVKLNYFADNLGNGTELGLYYFHYHSRLPYLGLFAAQESCARYSTSATVITDCEGFNGFDGAGPGEEPLHVDTIRLRVDYPENIDLFGASFTTNIGSWSIAGDVSYRPNVPMQVHVNDLAFAALQPTFPNHDQYVGISGLPPALQELLGPLGLGGLDVIKFPGARSAVPDYIETRYRGNGHYETDPNTGQQVLVSDVQQFQYIQGYERMRVGQFDITVLQAFSNVLGADQIIFIGEVGGTYVFNMPSLDQVQFEGGGLNQTHYSPGADGTDQPNTERGNDTTGMSFNPTKQTGDFADAFSWGLRTLIRGEYNDVVFGWTFMPIIVAGWDVNGIAPYPLQNFIEGRYDTSVGSEIKITPSLTATVVYQWFLGGGTNNTRLDRDNLSLAVAYTF